MPSPTSSAGRKPLAALAVLLLLTGGACRKSEKDTAADRSVRPRPATTTTTLPADPYAIPAKIDVAYVQRVFDALDEIRGEVIKDLLAGGQFTAAMGARAATIYNPPLLELQLQGLGEVPARGLEVFKQPPGIRRTIVRRLISAGPHCISAEVEYDSSQVLKRPPPATSTYLGLQPTQPSLDPADVNPTPFSIFFEDQRLEEPCVAS